MKKLSSSLLVVLGTASLLTGLAGCGGKLTAPPSPPPPTTEKVSIAAVKPAVLGQVGLKSLALAANVTVTNPNSADTAISCASSDANLLSIIDPVACTAKPSATGAGDVTITATAHADSTKTATFVVHVGNYALVANNVAGLQMVDVGRGTPAVTLLHNNLPLHVAQWFSDRSKIAGTDLSAATSSVINIYTTDGTGSGTVFDHKLDVGAIGNDIQVTSLAVSPDGTTIAFVAQMGGNVQGIYTVSVAADAKGNAVVSAPLHTEPPNGSRGISGIWYTPDGRILVENVVTETMYIINADGSGWQELVSSSSNVAMYSPDMKTLYYAFTDENNAAHTWVVDAVSKSIITTIDGYVVVAVEPNGSGILLTDGANIFTADAMGQNISQNPIAAGNVASM